MNSKEVKTLQQSPNEQNETSAISYCQFPSICRTCLAEGDIKPIFDVFYEEQPICDLLRTHTTLKIHLDDNLPQNICCSCLKDLLQAHLFIKKCQQSNETLNSIIKTEEDNFLQISSESKDTIEDLFEELNTTDADETEIKIPNPKRRYEDGPPYECKTCDATFEYFEFLKAHCKELSHGKIAKVSCTVCLKTFTSTHLRRHMRTHIKKKIYKCKICFKSFCASYTLKRHMKIHMGGRPYICEVCGKGFLEFKWLQNHKQTHTEDYAIKCRKFVCNYCGKGFKRLVGYNTHIKKHFLKASEGNDVRQNKCGICNKTFKAKRLLKAHEVRHGEKSFLCSYCGKGFAMRANLNIHLKIHTGEKPYTCNICNKSFTHVSNLRYHKFTHTGVKPYKCNVCEKKFTRSAHLKHHLRIHSGERPYSCLLCGKKFGRKWNLTVHVRTHTGETPYICHVCGKGFHILSNLKKHKMIHGIESIENPVSAPANNTTT